MRLCSGDGDLGVKGRGAGGASCLTARTVRRCGVVEVDHVAGSSERGGVEDPASKGPGQDPAAGTVVDLETDRNHHNTPKCGRRLVTTDRYSASKYPDSQPTPLLLPSNPCGSGGRTVNRRYGVSPQSRSRDSGGTHTVGYDGSQSPPLPAEVATRTVVRLISAGDRDAGSSAVGLRV